MVGKKKRGHPDVEEVLARPWCYYCERDFDDLKILISHQKAKHFKCERCGRRLNTAGGLSVHMNQVHKETLTSVDNALGNRAGLEVEIFGMEGIPEEVAQAHNQRIVTQFYQAEADRRAATGNTGQGGGGGGVSKKPKFEAPSELKKRLAEHKARLAEQAAGGGSSGENTPGEALNAQSPALAQSPSAFNGSPYPPPPNTYDGQSQPGYQSYSQAPYQPPTTYQPQYNAQPAYSPPQSQYAPQYPPQSYPPQQSFPPAGYQQPPFQGGPPPYSAGSPPAPYNAYQPPPGMLPNRPPGLPGLPQRPSFGAPGAYPPQQMQGPPGAQYPGQGPPPNGSWNGNGWKGPEQNAAMSSAYPPHSGYNGNNGANAGAGDDIDEIIRMAEAGIRPPKKGDPTPTLAQNPSPLAPVVAAAPFAQIETPQATTPDIPDTLEKADLPEKKSKKDKEKNTKMVYSDNEVSPEEKMARLPRYAFVPEASSDAPPIKTADADMVTA